MSSKGMPEPMAGRLGYLLKRAQHALRTRMDEALRPLGLTAPQYAVLAAIELEPGISSAALARAAFVTAQTMQGIVANLERQGLLERTADPAHGRILRSELTKRGLKAVKRAHAAVGGIEAAMIASFRRKDVARLADLLARCADNLAVAERDRVPSAPTATTG